MTRLLAHFLSARWKTTKQQNTAEPVIYPAAANRGAHEAKSVRERSYRQYRLEQKGVKVLMRGVYKGGNYEHVCEFMDLCICMCGYVRGERVCEISACWGLLLTGRPIIIVVAR